MSWLTSEESIQRYNEALNRAANEDEAFRSFRRAPGVREIVEGVPDVVGQGYFAKLVDELSLDTLTMMWERATKNDLVGEPQLVQLRPDKVASSTTMRYLWNVVDMERHGVTLDDVDVVEVGGGYGGLCRMIHEFHKPRSYTIIDLPEALALADRYLKCYGINARMVPCDAYAHEPIDTFISNYALTELTKDVQEEYIQKLMCNAKHGYVTYNSQPRNAFNQYSLEQLRLGVFGKVTIEDENVKKSECQVLIWRP